MLVSWYLPHLGFSLWPCAILLVVFIPVPLWHERNWRRTLAQYADARRSAGAPAGPWPSPSLSHIMGVQPWLLFTVSAMLGLMTIFAAWTAIIWPHRPPGFDLPINPFDLPFIWSMVVAGTAAVVAVVAIALDIHSSPWAGVAHNVRRAMYAKPAERERRFALALAADPEVRAAQSAAAADDAAPPPAEPPAEPGSPATPLPGVPPAAAPPAP